MNKPHIEIKFYRERAGLTRAELASMIGIDVYDLVCMEKGTLMPTTENMQLIAHACDTSLDELFGLAPENGNPELF